MVRWHLRFFSFTTAVSEAADKYGKPAARYNTKLPKEDDDDVLELRRLVEIKDTTTDEMERTRKYKAIYRMRRRIQTKEQTATSDFAIAQKRPLPRPKRAITVPYSLRTMAARYLTTQA